LYCNSGVRGYAKTTNESATTMLTPGVSSAYMMGQTPASSLQPVNRQVDDMNNRILLTLAATLFVAPATAAPAPASVHDRIAELCTVSNTDLEGQRLARACRAEVRAQAAAERLAATAPRRVRIAEASRERPR
jgi:hypothetical protein